MRQLQHENRFDDSSATILLLILKKRFHCFIVVVSCSYLGWYCFLENQICSFISLMCVVVVMSVIAHAVAVLLAVQYELGRFLDDDSLLLHSSIRDACTWSYIYIYISYAHT